MNEISDERAKQLARDADIGTKYQQQYVGVSPDEVRALLSARERERGLRGRLRELADLWHGLGNQNRAFSPVWEACAVKIEVILEDLGIDLPHQANSDSNGTTT